MIMGTATRYLAGRGAVQTVYWVGDKSGNKMVKYSKVLTFPDKGAPVDKVSSTSGFPFGQSSLSSSPSTHMGDRRSFHTTAPLLR